MTILVYTRQVECYSVFLEVGVIFYSYVMSRFSLFSHETGAVGGLTDGGSASQGIEFA